MNGLLRPWPQSVQLVLIFSVACLAAARIWPAAVTRFSTPVPVISAGVASLKAQSDDLAADWVSVQTGRPRAALTTIFSGGRNGHFTVVYEDSAGGQYQMVIQVDPGGNSFRWAMWPYRRSYS
jgi:hypothetical protein